MAKMQLNITSGFYKSPSLPFASQRCINAVPVTAEGGALSDIALFGTPGIKTFSTTGATISGVNRGVMIVKGVPYFVNGSNLYSVTSVGVVTDHGSVGATGRVSMANNGQYVVVVNAGGDGYVYDNIGDTLNKITSANYRVSDTVVFKDGYFVFTATAGDVFFNSALNDPLTFDALDFGTAEINPDRIVAAHVNHNELFICGEETIEIFQNIGGSGFPFQRIPGANIQKGVAARHTLREFDNTFVFVGGGANERPAIWKVSGSSNVQKISTDAIDNEIQKFTSSEISDAFAFDYSSGGRFFVGFTFEAADDRIPSKTFVFDATSSAMTQTAVWHERQTGVTDGRWRVNGIVRAFGKLLVTDNVDGRIGELDGDTYTEYGNVIFRSKSSTPFNVNGLPMFWGEISLTMETGVGLTTGQGSDPIIRMDFSDNGGRTFSSELSRSYGKIGEYESLPTWRRMGRIPRHRVVRFTTTEPVKFVIIKMEALAEGGFQ